MRNPNLTLKTKIDLAFVAIAIIFAVLIYSTYSSAEAVKQNRLIIYQTGNINTILEKVMSSATDIETGTRGYAITGDDSYLEVYKNGNRNVNLWLDSLRSMNNTDSDQLRKLDSIEKLIHAKKQISAMTISVRRSEGLNEASKLIEIGRGKEIMDSIRGIITDFQKSQINILSEKLSEINEKVRIRNLYFLFFVIVTISLIVLSYRIIRRNAEKLLEKEIVQSDLIHELSIQNVQMNDFANITSHNLRSPAANITSLISIIDEKSEISDYKMIFEMLKKVSENLNETLNHLLEILSIKKNKGIEKEQLQFKAIFSKAVESLQGEILTSNAEISSDFSKAPEITYPRIYMESIFHNLISNALKYRATDRIPSIDIKTEVMENTVLLSITDNGLGIDLNRHGTKIFGMHKVFHHHPDAKGIGLFITKAQIESLDGKISVKSEVGSGSTFTVSFLIK